jgi:hypothetical protein
MDALASYRDDLTSVVRDVGAQAALQFDMQWRDLAAETIRRLADTGRPFSSDDARWTIPEPPSPGALGAAFLAASRRGDIEPCGWTISRRLQTHGRAIRLWRGVS